MTKNDALLTFGSVVTLCTVQIQATSPCSRIVITVIHVSSVQSGRGSALLGQVEFGVGVVWVEVVSLLAASSWWRLDSSARGQLHIGLLPASGCGPRAHPLLDFSSHGHKGLLYIGGILGTSFQKGDTQRVCKLLNTTQEGQSEVIYTFILVQSKKKKKSVRW